MKPVTKKIPCSFSRIMCLLLLSFASLQSQATDGIFKGLPLYGKNHQIAADSTIYVTDTVLNNATLRAGWSVNSVRNVITFKINEFANLVIPDNFQVTLKFRFTTTKWIYSTNQPGTAVTTTADSTLYIDYSKSNYYTGKSVLVLPDVFNSTVKIVSVSVTDTSSNVYKSLMVENEIQVSKEYTSFDCTNNAVQTISQLTSTVATDGELQVYWSPATGADEYDLEWNYIDSSALASYLIAGTSNYDSYKVFTNNASRVSISNESYKIPLLYDNSGKLFYRVRSVKLSKGGQRIEAAWSSSFTNGLGNYDYTGHERKLNWQAKTNFAEDGKRKSVIQYFDGSLRSRQTVTKDNTTDTTIVAETFYDNQGRPALQVLPSPSLSRIIKYNPAFNVTVNSTEYDKSYYDDVLANTSYCDAGAAPMGTQSGASHYYSPDNQNVNNGLNRFIPDAEQYPFTETKYTQDNTGRVSAQGGVGPHHQLGQTDTNDATTKDHETKYYYGSADQEDLDALFGTEAGNYTHYFKNMVRDANGQYSVSYMDMHGRTVATALAGTPLNTSLALLPSNQSQTVTKKLLDSNNNIIRENAIEAIKTLVVTKSGNHYFDYSLSPESLQLTDCNSDTICYDCLYDLTITVTDNCNNQNLPGGVAHVITRKNFSLPQPDTTCTAAASFSVLDTLFNLKEGVYTIAKKLEISKYGMDYYRDSIFVKHNTCKTAEQFIQEQKQLILSNLNCGLTCAQCTDSLGTWDEFRNRYMQLVGISPADSAYYRGQAYQSYTDQLADCDLLCDKHSALDDLRMNMLADVTGPFGQYANDAKLMENKRDYYSIYNRLDGQASNGFRYMAPAGNVYLNADGTISNFGDDEHPIYPVTFSSSEFDDNFKSSWAESLLKYHPEYGKYETFAKLKPSTSWNEKFGSIETFREAYDSGYLNPTGNTAAPFNKYPVVSANVDPFYQNELDSFQTNNFKVLIESYMQDLDGPGANNTLSIWAAASSMSKCDVGDASCLANYADGSHAFDTTGAYSLCTAELDMAWRYFREMYINKKRTETNNFVNTANPISPQIPAGHVLHFPDINSLMTSGGGLTDDPAEGQDQLSAYINDNCTAAAMQWWRELAPCNYNTTDSAIIIPRLIAVCNEGGDATHPFGSRTVKPGSTNQYKSFEEVIRSYNLANNIPYGTSCTVDFITSPLPYNKEQAIANMEVWTKPDSCTCSGINLLYNQYTAYPGEDTSFANYVNRTNGIQMTEADLQTLRGMCDNTLACSKLETPIILPPVLQCGTVNGCATCTEVTNLKDSFDIVYPGTLIAYDENTSTQRTKNRLFESYMNTRLGFTKTAQQYLDFLDTCSNYSSESCDSLQEIIKGFVQTTKSGRVSHTFATQEGQQFHDLHLITDTSTIHLPDSIRAKSNTWYNNWGINTSGFSFCMPGGYSSEIKMKLYPMVKSGDLFYTQIGGSLNIVVRRAYNNIPGLYTEINGTNYVLDPNPNVSVIWNWMKIRLTTTKTRSLLYYNDSLIVSLPRDSTQAIGSRTSFGMGIFGRQGTIDYFKVTDTLGNIKYFEDYNSPDYPATFDTSAMCPKPANCETAFANYFNQQKGTNYTFDQIDSLYYHSCGRALDVCSNNNTSQDSSYLKNSDKAPHLCGKSEPIFTTMIPTQWNQCDDSTNFAISKGTLLYEAYRDSLNDVFTAAYRQKCLNAQKLESFTVTAPVSEYHYTLYYYGQAGNLIKTVPPTGVDITKFTDANWSASVATARANNQWLTPSHAMATVYRYNTLNQVTAQYTPDAHKSEFWYDRLGRLAVSQNAKQQNNTTENGRKYSYTLYDYLGRITEVGEYINPSTSGMSQTISRSQTQLTSWLSTQANRSQITSTVYDLEYPGWVLPDKVVYAKNLRNRVAYTSYTQGSNPLNFNSATFYTYDILGNVDTLIQDYGSNSASNGTQNMMNKNNNRWKKMVYQYDLISGKVNHVAYEPQYVNPADGKLYRPNDAMYHKYEYDAENRLTAAYTSMDSVIWEKDARYEYYLHGPLARMVLGDQMVQGTDYAYTLQGWLKGVNSINQTSDRDMGGDGYAGAGYDQNKYVAKDAFGFNLDYYKDDYASIKNSVLPFPQNPVGSAWKPLYNGNISSMGVNIKNLNKPGGGQGAILYNYGYDQLNRLTAMDAYVGLTNNTWTPELREQYKERIAYDGNGNILKYLRHGDKTTNVVMDSLTYQYDAGTNQLNHVTDLIGENVYPSTGYMDIDNQAVNNYAYDEIGNLTKDVEEEVTNIEWNVYGKITKLSLSNTTVGKTRNVYYYYDAAGNRICKRNEINASSGTTSNYLWYVRDGSGNVMATYNNNPATNDNIPNTLTVKERHLYGSSRLGIYTLKKDVKATPPSGAQTSPYNISFLRGYKSYELANHLGNVLSTISDEKFGHDGGGGIVDYFDADILGASDYYPFGATQPNRSTGTSYRYGFNGKEKDNEGTSTQYDYGFRIYDPRLGRFKSVDPLMKQYPALTPYQFASNNPIEGIDVDGLEYLSSKKARIEVVNGLVKLKIDNMTTVVKNALKAYHEDPNNWKVDPNTGFTAQGADFSVGRIGIGNIMPQFPNSVPDPTDGNPNNRPDQMAVGKPTTQRGTIDQRYKDRSVTTASPGGAKGFAYLQVAMIAMEGGVSLYMQNAQENENYLVNKHIGFFKLAAADVNYALKNSKLISTEFQTTQYLSDIINIVLSGESYVSKYDEATGAKLKQIGMDIYNTYSIKRIASTTQTTETSGLDGISIKKTATILNPAYDAKYVKENPAIGENPKQ